MSSSWATSEENIISGNIYPLWNNPNNGVHQLQWQLLKIALSVVNKLDKKSLNYKEAILEFDKSCISCQFWWASASPWWDAGFIRFRAKKLMNIINKYANSRVAKDLGKKLYQELIKTVSDWERSGLVKKIQDACLAGKPYQIYFSGRKM